MKFCPEEMPKWFAWPLLIACAFFILLGALMVFQYAEDKFSVLRLIYHL